MFITTLVLTGALLTSPGLPPGHQERGPSKARAKRVDTPGTRIRSADQDAIRELKQITPEKEYKQLQMSLRVHEREFDFGAAASVCKEFESTYPILAGLVQFDRAKYLLMQAKNQEADILMSEWDDSEAAVRCLKGFALCKVGRFGLAKTEDCRAVVLALFPSDWEMGQYWPDKNDEQAATFECALASSTLVGGWPNDGWHDYGFAKLGRFRPSASHSRVRPGHSRFSPVELNL